MKRLFSHCAHHTASDILGNSQEAQHLRNTIQSMGKGQYPILMIGERGVGKFMAASALHNAGPRSFSSFLALCCTDLNLDFFSLHKGGDCSPLLAMADKGTLLLAGLEEMPFPLQEQLFDFLNNSNKKLPDKKTTFPDIRLIVAADPGLEDMATTGQIHPGLYSLLSLHVLTVPPLRQRQGDVELLALHFLEQNNRHEGLDKIFRAESIELLRHYQWPGNIEELSFFIRLLHKLCRSGSIGVAAFPPAIVATAVNFLAQSDMGLDALLDEVAMDVVSSIMNATQGNISKTAALMKISRPRLYRLLGRMGFKTSQREVGLQT